MQTNNPAQQQICSNSQKEKKQTTTTYQLSEALSTPLPTHLNNVRIGERKILPVINAATSATRQKTKQ